MMSQSVTSMTVTITTDTGVIRTFSGDSDTLQNNDWEEIMLDIIESK